MVQLLPPIGLLSEMGLPQGRMVSEQGGGEDAMQRALSHARRFLFTGYIRTVLESEGTSSEGLLAFRGGEPLMAVYAHRWEGAGRVYMGRRAVEFMWEDSVFPQARLTVHAEVSPEDLQGRFPRSEIVRTDLLPPSLLPRPPPRIEELEELGEDLGFPATDWEDNGYDLSGLVRLWKRDREEAVAALPYFEANLRSMEELRSRLDRLDTVGYEREAESVLRRTVDPERTTEVEEELEELEARIGGPGDEGAEIEEGKRRKRVDEQMDAVYDLILRYHRMSSQGGPELECPRCGSLLDSSGQCPGCSENPLSFGRALNPRYTFDSFVVGRNSRFAVAAGKAVARNPGEAYNPLFIHSRSGLGKTHLLQAIGHRVGEKPWGPAVIYSSAEVLESEIVAALRSGEIDRLREEYASVDLLLMDDLQFLAGKEQTQDELFNIFGDMVDGGKQVVLACDRLPKDIPSISERLITRFESGLIADLQPPDLQTRMAILESMVEGRGIPFPKEVLRFVAATCTDNVRQLEGGMNKVMAYASLMGTEINLDTAREVLALETPSEEELEELKGGHSYLVEERGVGLSHRLTASLITRGFKGLAITRSHPRYLQSVCGNGDLRTLWLTEQESDKEETLGPSLERAMLIIDEFLERQGSKAILLDDIQYLISNTSFEGVIRFVRSVVDRVHESDSVFLLSMNPYSLDLQRRSVIEREMEVVREDRPN
ncbi:MAG: DnaA ATPase domain-containing protein [Methanomassiliicoccales archaeon]